MGYWHFLYELKTTGNKAGLRDVRRNSRQARTGELAQVFDAIAAAG